MAFLDRMNTFSNAQVVTTTAISTDVLDTNNTGSPNYNTGTGTAGDQEGDFDMYNPSPNYDYDVENQEGGFYGN
jgi:hypothetical protein